MALFKNHCLIGTTIGGAYGAVGYFCGMPLESSVISAGLFSLASVLPDIDTDSIPLHELASLLGAGVGIVVALYAQTFKYSPENLLLMGAIAYLIVRFCIIGAFVHFAVHRGIFHSLLMALFLAEIGYALCTGEQLYKSAAIFGGYVTHLIVDEICGFKKQSLGTALKLWGQNWIVNFTVMAAMIAVGVWIWLK